jgi:hypothetical protein
MNAILHACVQCEIGRIANGTWEYEFSTTGCPSNLTGPGVIKVTRIPPSAGEKFYATNSSQC